MDEQADKPAFQAAFFETMHGVWVVAAYHGAFVSRDLRPECHRQHSCLLQSNSAPSAKRILNFRQGISGANQLINRGLWRIGPQLYAVTDVACWLAGVTERARYFHFDILNIDPALGHLSVKIVAKARRQSRKQ